MGGLAKINMAYSAVTDNGTGINTTAGGTITGTSPGTNLNAGNGTPRALPTEWRLRCNNANELG